MASLLSRRYVSSPSGGVAALAAAAFAAAAGGLQLVTGASRAPAGDSGRGQALCDGVVATAAAVALLAAVWRTHRRAAG